MPMIYLYAEVLANIRQANLYASLKTHKNEHTKIDIASDKQTVTVSHDGEIASIYLPTKIGGTAEVNIPIDRGKEMSVRLELEDIMTMPSVDNAPNEGPWPANELSANTRLRCRVCNTELLTNGTPMDFKDLPSEHWAEMMDFWHCHRPHDPEPSQAKEADASAHSKGYGSSTKLKAAPATVFVDTTSFLLAEQNCKSIQVGFTISYSIYLSFLRSQRWAAFLILLICNLPVWVTRRRPFPHRKRYQCSGRRYNCPKLNKLVDYEG
jgi:ubiquitin-protein ligase E3 D